MPVKRHNATDGTCQGPTDGEQTMQTQSMKRHAPGLAFRLVGINEVMVMTGLSESTILRGMSEGWFPRGKKVGPRAVRWNVAQLEAWVEGCAEVGTSRAA